ncbi:MAG: EamA family transporter [Flavobacteriia bacterium]|nr:EamA family transporter [Flavobacteriia bacterium]
MQASNKKHILILILCTIIWGTTFAVIKGISDKIDPVLLSVLRNWIAVVAFGIFLLFKKKLNILKNRKAIKYGIILGVIIGAIYIIQTVGLSVTSSTHSAFITSSAVIMVPILLFFVGQNKIDWKQLLTIVIVSFGLYLLTNSNSEANFNWGDFLTLIGAVVCALNIILSGEYVRKSELYGLIFYQFLFAGIISTICLFIKLQLIDEPLMFELNALPSVVYLSLFGTLLCYFLMIWAQQYVSIIATAMILSLEPIFATTTSYLYMGEFIMISIF